MDNLTRGVIQENKKNISARTFMIQDKEKASSRYGAMHLFVANGDFSARYLSYRQVRPTEKELR